MFLRIFPHTQLILITTLYQRVQRLDTLVLYEILVTFLDRHFIDMNAVFMLILYVHKYKEKKKH